MRLALHHTLRLWRILRALGRADALFPLDRIELPPVARALVRLLAGRADRRFGALRPGERLSVALQDLGPSFIKLGQALSVRADLVGAEVAADLGELRDRLPAVETRLIRETIARELGRPAEDLFAHFDDTAVAAASIAQVHFATTAGGDAVAVKVLRPGVEARLADDLRLFGWLAEQVERRVPQARRLRPGEVVRTLAESVALEMDLRMEAAAASELGQAFTADAGFRAPAIRWELTSRRVLTMERIEGISLSDREAIRDAGHDLERLAVQVIQTFLTQALEHGFFHADMHHGNLFVAPDGALVAVDFGIMGRLDRKTRLFMADMLHAFIVGDWRRAAEVHFAAGYVPPDRSVDAFAQACRAVGEPIRGRPVSEISLGRLLAQLFQITELFGMRTQPHLLLLQKTMVTVEGVARDLDPNVNFWEAARPVIEPWAMTNLSPEARLKDLAVEAARALAQLPAAISAAIERAGHRADGNPPVDREPGPVGRWLLPIAVLVLAAALLIA